MSLRPYQEEIVNKMLWGMSLDGNNVIVAAQGSGKTHIIAEFTSRLGEPMLILVPNKELLEQDLDKLSQTVSKDEIGVYSASMNSKEVKKYTLATIQSAYKHPEQFYHFKVVIVDECDLIPPKSMTGMYRKFFKAIGNPKIFGLTGTPFRQDHYYERWGTQKWMVKTITTTKMINRYAGFFWSRFLCVINTQELLDMGYLSPIEYHDVRLIDHEEIKTNKSKSDFDMEDFENKIHSKYQGIADYIKKLPHKGKLVFASSIEQAKALQSLVEGSVVVTSETSRKEREKAVEDLKAGRISVVFNVGIFTVGFDYPQLESIILLRPTRSLRLHCQILGRVSRIAPGKECGHVYDLVSNVRNLGKLEDIRIEKNSEGKWDVKGGLYPDGFHMKPLYSYQLKHK